MQFSAIIPAWNEARTIERAVRETRAALDGIGKPYELIVVDDGSTDTTAQIVERMGNEDRRIRLIRQEANRGKGAAVKTGALAAQGEWIVFLDADLSVHPSAIRDVVPVMQDADVIIGSRRVRDAEIPEPQPLARDYAGRMFNLVVRLMTGLPYRDSQCGFKAFHRRVLPVFQNLETTGWSFDVELLARAIHTGFRITEIPVTWRHGRESRVKWGDVGDVLGELWRIRTLSK